MCRFNLLLVAIATVFFPAPGGPVKRTPHGGREWLSLEWDHNISYYNYTSIILEKFLVYMYTYHRALFD